jgi:DNA repair exonuclease SbcCD ATPase subunit
MLDSFISEVSRDRALLDDRLPSLIDQSQLRTQELAAMRNQLIDQQRMTAQMQNAQVEYAFRIQALLSQNWDVRIFEVQQKLARGEGACQKVFHAITTLTNRIDELDVHKEHIKIEAEALSLDREKLTTRRYFDEQQATSLEEEIRGEIRRCHERQCAAKRAHRELETVRAEKSASCEKLQRRIASIESNEGILHEKIEGARSRPDRISAILAEVCDLTRANREGTKQKKQDIATLHERAQKIVKLREESKSVSAARHQVDQERKEMKRMFPENQRLLARATEFRDEAVRVFEQLREADQQETQLEADVNVKIAQSRSTVTVEGLPEVVHLIHANTDQIYVLGEALRGLETECERVREEVASVRQSVSELDRQKAVVASELGRTKCVRNEMWNVDADPLLTRLTETLRVRENKRTMRRDSRAKAVHVLEARIAESETRIRLRKMRVEEQRKRVKRLSVIRAVGTLLTYVVDQLSLWRNAPLLAAIERLRQWEFFLNRFLSEA